MNDDSNGYNSDTEIQTAPTTASTSSPHGTYLSPLSKFEQQQQATIANTFDFIKNNPKKLCLIHNASVAGNLLPLFDSLPYTLLPKNIDKNIYILLMAYCQAFLDYQRKEYLRLILEEEESSSQSKLHKLSIYDKTQLESILSYTKFDLSLFEHTQEHEKEEEEIELEVNKKNVSSVEIFLLHIFLELEKLNYQELEKIRQIINEIFEQYQLGIKIEQKKIIDKQDKINQSETSKILPALTQNSQYYIIENPTTLDKKEIKELRDYLMLVFTESSVIIYSLGSALMLCILLSSMLGGAPLLVLLAAVGIPVFFISYYFYRKKVTEIIKDLFSGLHDLSKKQKIGLLSLGLLCAIGASIGYSLFLKIVIGSMVMTALVAGVGFPPALAAICGIILLTLTAAVVTLVMLRLAKKIAKMTWFTDRWNHLVNMWKFTDKQKENTWYYSYCIAKATIRTSLYMAAFAFFIFTTVLAYSVHWFHAFHPIIFSIAEHIPLEHLTFISNVIWTYAIASPLKLAFNASYATESLDFLVTKIISIPEAIKNAYENRKAYWEYTTSRAHYYWDNPKEMIDLIVSTVVSAIKLLLGIGNMIGKLALSHSPIGFAGNGFYEGTKAFLGDNNKVGNPQQNKSQEVSSKENTAKRNMTADLNSDLDSAPTSFAEPEQAPIKQSTLLTMLGTFRSNSRNSGKDATNPSAEAIQPQFSALFTRT